MLDLARDGTVWHGSVRLGSSQLGTGLARHGLAWCGVAELYKRPWSTDAGELQDLERRAAAEELLKNLTLVDQRHSLEVMGHGMGHDGV